MAEKINLIIREMQKEFPDFGLTGEFFAQGDEVGDVWKLVMVNNVATVQDINLDSIDETYDKAVKYVQDSYCKTDSNTTGFMLLGDVAKLIEITTGKLPAWETLAIHNKK